MIREKILEYNKRCAEFLNWEFDELSESYQTPFLKLVEPQAFGDEQFSSKLRIYELDFDSDWNWIMEVVEAIETKFLKYTLQWEYDDREEFAEDGKYKAYWFTLYPKDEICGWLTDLRHKSRKEAVVQAINQFLIWYNKNKLQ